MLAIPSPLRAQTQPPSDSEKATNPNAILKVGGDVSAPRVIYGPEPEYTDEPQKAHFTGTCVLSVVVDPNGLPRDIAVKKSLGVELDERAIAAVRRWRFSPATKDGAPVAVIVSVEVLFSFLGNTSPPKYANLIPLADAGDAKSQYELALLFLSDSPDMKYEYRGPDYLEKSARQGFPKAEFAMGDYLSSHGSDLPTAYVWYARAKKNHVEHSGQKMKELVKRMTPQQLAEAKKRAKNNGP